LPHHFDERDDVGVGATGILSLEVHAPIPKMKADGLLSHAKLRGALRDRVTRPKVGDDCDPPSLYVGLVRVGQTNLLGDLLHTLPRHPKVAGDFRLGFARPKRCRDSVGTRCSSAGHVAYTAKRMRGGVKGAR
jgi:hypothetical protein